MKALPHGDAARALVAHLLRSAGLEARGLTGERLDHGKSGDLVYRIDAPMVAFAKIADPERRVSGEELAREIAVLRWFDGRCGAPRPMWSGRVDGRPALLMEALPGAPLHQLADATAEAGVAAAIQALARLHMLPIEDCPFDARLETKLGEARSRVAAGEVDTNDFDPNRAGRSAEDILNEVEGSLPSAQDLVVTHGDACWPNFVVSPGGEAGLIDLGRAGVADRYQDLALFIRSGQRNLPCADVCELIERFYPLGAIDQRKVEFFQLLDELF